MQSCQFNPGKWRSFHSSTIKRALSSLTTLNNIMRRLNSIPRMRGIILWSRACYFIIIPSFTLWILYSLFEYGLIRYHALNIIWQTHERNNHNHTGRFLKWELHEPGGSNPLFIQVSLTTIGKKEPMVWRENYFCNAEKSKKKRLIKKSTD